MTSQVSTEFERFDLVIHRRTGDYYKIDRFLKVRIGDNWEAGVGYYSVDDYEAYYVRPLENFIAGFALVKVK